MGATSRSITLLTAASILSVMAAPAGARLQVHPMSYDLQVDQGEALETPLHITNIGPANPLGFSVSDDRPWLSEFPTSGQIAIGDTVEVTVTVDASELAPGDYTGTITVTDPHHGPIYIPVALNVQGTTGVEDESSSASGAMRLAQSSPNPMVDAVGIRWVAPRGAFARLTVLDVTGREVSLLFAGPVRQEEAWARWSGLDRAGRPVPSGVYFYALESGRERLVRQLVLIR